MEVSRYLFQGYTVLYNSVWDMVCAHNTDHSSIFEDHHEALPVQSGALMDLQ
jgi:hypothetical protein